MDANKSARLALKTRKESKTIKGKKVINLPVLLFSTLFTLSLSFSFPRFFPLSVSSLVHPDEAEKEKQIITVVFKLSARDEIISVVSAIKGK